MLTVGEITYLDYGMCELVTICLSLNVGQFRRTQQFTATISKQTFEIPSSSNLKHDQTLSQLTQLCQVQVKKLHRPMNHRLPVLKYCIPWTL